MDAEPDPVGPLVALPEAVPMPPGAVEVIGELLANHMALEGTARDLPPAPELDESDGP